MKRKLLRIEDLMILTNSCAPVLFSLHVDVRAMVRDYFKSESVTIKDADPSRFDIAVKVFVDCQQTAVLETAEATAPSWIACQTNYENAKEKYINQKRPRIKKRYRVRVDSWHAAVCPVVYASIRIHSLKICSA